MTISRVQAKKKRGKKSHPKHHNVFPLLSTTTAVALLPLPGWWNETLKSFLFAEFSYARIRVKLACRHKNVLHLFVSHFFCLLYGFLFLLSEKLQPLVISEPALGTLLCALGFFSAWISSGKCLAGNAIASFCAGRVSLQSSCNWVKDAAPAYLCTRQSNASMRGV